MRLGEFTPDRWPAAVKRAVSISFVLLLQWSVVVSAWETGPDARQTAGVSIAGQHLLKCAGSGANDAPTQKHCRHTHCCILGAGEIASLARATVGVILLSPQHPGDASARPFGAPAALTPLVSAARVGSQRSPPAAA